MGRLELGAGGFRHSTLGCSRFCEASLEVFSPRNLLQSLLLYCLGSMWEAEVPKWLAVFSLMLWEAARKWSILLYSLCSMLYSPQTSLKFLLYCFWDPAPGGGAATLIPLFHKGMEPSSPLVWVDGIISLCFHPYFMV